MSLSFPTSIQIDARSDLYALGATLYQWLTGHLPYGEVEPYQLARFRRDPRAPSRLRPDVPMWLDHVVLRAVARDPRQRFETAEELVLALERGASRPLERPAATPYFTRDPATGEVIATVAPETKDTVLKLMSSPEVPTVTSICVVPAPLAIRAQAAVPVASADVSLVMAFAVATPLLALPKT